MSSSIDAFPFVGAVPNHNGHFLAAGFTGHGLSSPPSASSVSALKFPSGMPRILLSAAHITPLILASLGVHFTIPKLVKPYPPLPKPFHITTERVARLQNVDAQRKYNADLQNNLDSAKEPFCRRQKG